MFFLLTFKETSLPQLTCSVTGTTDIALKHPHKAYILLKRLKIKFLKMKYMITQMIDTVEKVVFVSRVGLFSHPLNPNISKLRDKVNILGGPLKEFSIILFHQLLLWSSCHLIALSPHLLATSSSLPPSELWVLLHSFPVYPFSFHHQSDFSIWFEGPAS